LAEAFGSISWANCELFTVIIVYIGEPRIIKTLSNDLAGLSTDFRVGNYDLSYQFSGIQLTAVCYTA